MALLNTNYTSEVIDFALNATQSVYFIGIGGVSMSCLAEICFEKGLRVGGSDRTPSAITDSLAKKGISVFYGHKAEQVEGYGIVVYTLAIDLQNEEYKKAQSDGILCVSRANFLGFLMRDYKNRIGISGMHGKSTTTSMLASVFSAAKANPTVVSGAALSQSEGCYRAGGREFFIYEACEYMDSFLCFHPTVSIILNVELDHTDYFADIDAVCSSFEKSLGRLDENGVAVLNFDDENVMRVAQKLPLNKKITFGLKEGADIRAVDIEENHGFYSFSAVKDEALLGRIELSTPGKHHVYNALATLCAATLHGIAFEAIANGLADFKGARRRMEYHGTLNGVDIYEDYAHHPTEISATLTTAKKMTQGDVWCVFQSHTYSRTAELFDDFVLTLSKADRALILPIYAARETDTRGMSEEKLAKALSCHATPVKSFQEAADFLRNNAKKGDLAIIMGAGDVFHVLGALGLGSCL